MGGAVVGLEEVDEVLGRAVAEGVGPALGPQCVDVRAEQAAQMILVAPEGRRAHAGRRRDVLADGPEQAADEPPRGPAGQRDRAARAAYAHELVRGALVVGREHDADHGDDGVKGRVLERQRFGVALDEAHRQLLGGGALAPALQQRRDVVERHDVAEHARRGQRGVAAASGDVEHARSGAQVGGVAEVLGDDRDERADGGVVAAGPGRLLLALDGFQVGGGRGGAGLCHGRQASRGPLAVA